MVFFFYIFSFLFFVSFYLQLKIKKCPLGERSKTVIVPNLSVCKGSDFIATAFSS